MYILRRLLYLNFRLVYRLSRAGRHRLTPAGALLFGGMIFSGIFGIDTRQTLSFQVFSICTALLLFSFMAAFLFRGRFSLTRSLPEFGTVDTPLHYRLRINNHGSKHYDDLLLIDELHAVTPSCEEFFRASDPEDRNRNWFDRRVGYPRLMGMVQRRRGADIEPVDLPHLARACGTEVMFELRPARRGYINFSSSRVARPDPLGLVRGIVSTDHPDSLLILPQRYRVPLISMTGSRKYQHGGLNAASTVGDSQEFMSLRDYRPGDPMRSIHWRSYAKTGHPVVKEFQDEFIVRQGLLLDTYLEDRPAAIFENAVSIAASYTLAASGQAQDALLDLMLVGTQAYRFTCGRGLGTVENILEILACVEPCREPDFAVLRELVLRHVGETSGMICIFLDWDERRQRIVELLITMGIPVCIFLIVAGADAPEPGIPGVGVQHFFILHSGDLQSQLDALDLTPRSA